VYPAALHYSSSLLLSPFCCATHCRRTAALPFPHAHAASLDIGRPPSPRHCGFNDTCVRSGVTGREMAANRRKSKARCPHPPAMSWQELAMPPMCAVHSSDCRCFPSTNTQTSHSEPWSPHCSQPNSRRTMAEGIVGQGKVTTGVDAILSSGATPLNKTKASWQRMAPTRALPAMGQGSGRRCGPAQHPAGLRSSHIPRMRPAPQAGSTQPGAAAGGATGRPPLPLSWRALTCLPPCPGFVLPRVQVICTLGPACRE
jgi:hypothetical protein